MANGYVHRKPAVPTEPVGCVSVILDEFVDTDGTLLENHLTQEGYPWLRSENLFYPSGAGPEIDWAIEGNKLVPQEFLPWVDDDIFNIIDVALTAEKYEIYLDFLLENLQPPYIEFVIFTQIQPLTEPTSMGWVNSYLYLSLEGDPTTDTYGIAQWANSKDDPSNGDIGQYQEDRSDVGDAEGAARLSVGAHTIKVTVDRTSGTQVMAIYLDDVLFGEPVTFDQTHYDWYGSIPLPLPGGMVGFGLHHQGDPGDVKITRFEAKICSGEELPGP